MTFGRVYLPECRVVLVVDDVELPVGTFENLEQAQEEAAKALESILTGE